MTDVLTQEYAKGVKEYAAALEQIAMRRSFMKDIKEALKQKGVSKEDLKNLRKHAKLYIEQNKEEVKAEAETLIRRYEELSL